MASPAGPGVGSTPCTSVGKHEDQAVHHWLPVCLGGLQPGKTQLSTLGLPPNPGLHMCGTRLAKVAQSSGDLNPSVFTLAITHCHPPGGEVLVVDAPKICKGHLNQAGFGLHRLRSHSGHRLAPECSQSLGAFVWSSYHRPLPPPELLHPEPQPGADGKDPSHLGCFPDVIFLKAAEYEPSVAGPWPALILSAGSAQRRLFSCDVSSSVSMPRFSVCLSCRL